MTTGFLMGFPNTSSGVVQQTDFGLLYDPNAGIIYGVAGTSGSGLNGFRKWDAYPNGNELRARNLADLANGVTVYPVHCLAYSSQLIIMSPGASNSAPLNGFAMQDSSYAGTFGVTSSSLANSDNNRILASAQVVSFLDGHGRDVVVATPIRSGSFTGGAEINCVSWGTKQNRKSNVTENSALLGSIPDGSGRNAWALGYNLSAGTATLYRIGPTLGGNGIQATVGSLTAAQIDATWTQFSSIAGVAVDQKDGNLIVGFGDVFDSSPHQAYIVKLNATTGAIMWKLAVAGATGSLNFGDGTALARSVIKNGKLYYLGSGQTLYTIDTIAGTATTLTLDNGVLDSLHGTQISEDCCGGSVVWYGGWAEGATVPAYLGTYCLTQGNHSGSQMVWRYYPVAPVPCTDLVATSRKRAWSFTLDGHTFYVLDLGQEGTFLWDKSTNSWCQFITTGYTAWNFCNGCMWGQRIVAGDQLTTDLWEMLPASSLFDNSATEIQHVVTGGVATRNRIYHSVESFTLVASTAL